jgi:S-adenosylmethionine:tRNA ribosyltransferase-isomerase
LKRENKNARSSCQGNVKRKKNANSMIESVLASGGLCWSLAMLYFAARMRTEEFHYDLPGELIAQEPARERDASRLLVVDRKTGTRMHTRFPALLDYIKPGDLLVMNNSKVIPARLRAIKPETGGSVEILLVEEVCTNQWWVMLKPGKRVRIGTKLRLIERGGQASLITAQAQEKSEEGHYRLTFDGTGDIAQAVHELGEIPLPPYIQRPSGTTDQDLRRYQTVYAGPAGSVAAPTAGLHFTPELLQQIRRKGIETAELTLHVGLGTFAPVKVTNVHEHHMHEERFEIPTHTADLVNRARAEGRRVIAIGTTSLRVLESATEGNQLQAGTGRTAIFIYPPYRFKMVDALLTNFHLPESTLLMLVSAFASPGSTEGRKWILESYAEAVRDRYRFFSYGDAMLLL